MRKKKVRKCELGWNCAFSGRLNGVAPSALAAALASNGAVPSIAVSWIVIQRTGHDAPERMQPQLIVREHVSCRVLRREWNEHDRVAVD